MSDIRKFYADVQRCLKHERSDIPGGYDGLHAAKAVGKVFVSYNADLGSLPVAIADYWEQHYITESENLAAEPTEAHIDWLAFVLSFIDGEADAEQDIPIEDWNELAELVNSEAADLPIDVLSGMMSVLLERSVL